MTIEQAGTGTSPGELSRRVRVSRSVFRAVIALHALAVFTQPVLAGRFLIGDVAMLTVHGTIGTVVGVLGIVQLAVALVHRRIGRGPWWPVLACLGLMLAGSVQAYLGFSRAVGVHVPLGVAVVTATVLLFIAAWRPGFGHAGAASADGGSA
jgi:hypothetical protein